MTQQILARCKRCKRKMTNAKSIRRGFGVTCMMKYVRAQYPQGQLDLFGYDFRAIMKRIEAEEAS